MESWCLLSLTESLEYSKPRGSEDSPVTMSELTLVNLLSRVSQLLCFYFIYVVNVENACTFM